MTEASSSHAGDGLLRPLVLVALAGLLLNDHVLKAAAAGTSWGLLTGKLSDVCGLLFLPVLIVAATELLARALGRFHGPSTRVAVVVAVVVALAFTLMKTVPWVGERYVDAMGWLQWPFYAVVDVVAGRSLPSIRRVAFVMDPTDVIAAPFAFYVVLQARQRER
ncbi:MAG: hypothetical protein Q8O67_05975 [Deltaproteobacteria bacterium]|nr:hypothetical protein [Deltaproteobacteria bacterium]